MRLQDLKSASSTDHDKNLLDKYKKHIKKLFDGAVFVNSFE